jgi:hypothetical protein
MEESQGKDIILTLWSALLALYCRRQITVTLTPSLLESLDLFHLWHRVEALDRRFDVYPGEEPRELFSNETSCSTAHGGRF